MNLLKKLTATAAVVVLASSLMTTGANAATTAQIEAANTLAAKGIIVDHGDNPSAYLLDRTVLRQEIAAVARGIAGLEKATVCNNPYLDVTATTPNTWACYSIQPLKDHKLIAMNKRFAPTANITKAESIGMIVTAAYGDEYSYDPKMTQSWQEQVVAFAVSKGLVKNFTDYNALATRGFIFEAAANTYSDSTAGELGNLLCKIAGTCDTDKDDKKDDKKDDTKTPVVQGTASVTLSPESPTDGKVYANSNRAPLLAFDVTAGNSDVTLNKASLQFTGLGSAKIVTNLAIYSDDVKVTRGDSKRFSGKSQTSELSFDRDIVVKAGETKTFVVSATIDPDMQTGNIYNQTVRVNLTDLEGSATISGDNIAGPMLTPYAVFNNAALSFKNISTTGNMYLGQETSLVNFNVRETSRTQDMDVKSITIDNTGNADVDSLSDLALYVNGQKVEATFDIQRDQIVIVTDVKVNKGALANFVVKATATDDLGEKFVVKVTDVYALGTTSNISVGTTNDSNSDTTKTVTGSSVNFTFVRNETNEISPDTDDVKIGDLVFVTTADYNVNIQLSTTNSSAFDNLQIDGTEVDSTGKVKDIVLNKGTTTLPVTVDVKAGQSGTATFTATVTELEDAALGDKIDNLNSALNNNGLTKRLTIVKPGFRLSPINATDTSVVPTGNQQVVLYKGRIDVTGSESMLINNLVFKATDASVGGTSGNLQDYLSGVNLNIGGKTFNGTVNASTINFNSLYAELKGNAKDVQVLVTATLKDKENVSSGTKIQIVGDATNSNVTLTSGNDFPTNGVTMSSATSTTVDLEQSTTLGGTEVSNNQNEDTILAGTNNANIGSFRIDDTNSDIYFDSFRLKSNLTGANAEKLNSTLNNVRLVSGSTVIAQGGYIKHVDSTEAGEVAGNEEGYYVVFDNFTLPQSSNNRTIDVVADISAYNDNGGDSVAYLGKMKFDKILLKSYDLNTSGEFTSLGTVKTAEVNIVPAKITYSTNNSSSTSLGTVNMTVDTGNNSISTLTLKELDFANDLPEVAAVKVAGTSLTAASGADPENGEFKVDGKMLKFNRDITNQSSFSIEITLTAPQDKNVILTSAKATVDTNTPITSDSNTIQIIFAKS